MDKINFEPIGEAMQAFDTDKMDIGRRTSIINPDGTEGETNPEQPLYTDVACHISFKNIDNPDPNTSETRPINKLVTISCPVSTDLQNGDLITAYKLNSSGETLETYVGVIGEPSTSMSRKVADMAIRLGN